MANVQFFWNVPSGYRLKDFFASPATKPIIASDLRSATFTVSVNQTSVKVTYFGQHVDNGGPVSAISFGPDESPWMTYVDAGDPALGYYYQGSLVTFHQSGDTAAAIIMNGADSILGSWFGDYLDGYDGNDTIDGGAGEDTMVGGLGDDLYLVDSTTDRVIDSVGEGYDAVYTPVSYALAEGAEIEHLEAAPGTSSCSLTGNATSSTLIIGNDGSNTLNDGGGLDTLQGGPGDDTYVIQNSDTMIIELPGQGSDTILAKVNYALSDGHDIAVITATGRAPIHLTGNSAANIITGNVGDNLLIGLGASDSLYGDGGNDSLHGGEGADRLYSGMGNDRLYGENGRDKLYGDVGRDWLSGGADSDTLYGGTGNDTLSGGGGNDQLYGDMGNDRLYGGSGDDRLYSGLGSNTLSGGAGKDLLYGSYSDDVLNGDAGQDRLYGAAGYDTLSGGAGRDTLSGSWGYDTFVFDAKLNARTNVDRITDFDAFEDRIVLQNRWFAGISPKGMLSADAFWIGSQAHDSTDRIIYDRATGTLFFDPDGSGAAPQIKFFIIGNVDLTHAAVWVI